MCWSVRVSYEFSLFPRGMAPVIYSRYPYHSISGSLRLCVFVCVCFVCLVYACAVYITCLFFMCCCDADFSLWHNAKIVEVLFILNSVRVALELFQPRIYATLTHNGAFCENYVMKLSFTQWNGKHDSLKSWCRVRVKCIDFVDDE